MSLPQDNLAWAESSTKLERGGLHASQHVWERRKGKQKIRCAIRLRVHDRQNILRLPSNTKSERQNSCVAVGSECAVISSFCIESGARVSQSKSQPSTQVESRR